MKEGNESKEEFSFRKKIYWDVILERWFLFDEMILFGVYLYCEKSCLFELVWLLCLMLYFKL